MKAEYKEWMSVTRVIDDLDEFWIRQCNDGALQADKYWHECQESGEPYCYGRNDIYLNFYYAETRKQQILECTIVPPEVWEVPNRAFARLIKL